jgi:hypothetical protein
MATTLALFRCCALIRGAAAADLRTMYDACRGLIRRASQNGRGGKFLDYTMTAGHLIVTAIVALLSAGVKMPIF